MEFEVLMSTMNQTNFDIITETNIQSNAIIVNQTQRYDYDEVKVGMNSVKILSMNDLGVGKSRNAALMKSTAKICLIADDDIEYNEKYDELIISEFKSNPKADIIIFDIDIYENGSLRKKRLKNQRVNKVNFMKHGGPSIAFRRESIISKNIFFSLLFGGGATYGSGEDSLFLKHALNAGLRVYSVNVKIGTINNTKRESSWFTGYNEKYLLDRGALFYNLFPKFWILICLQFSIRHHSRFPKEYSRIAIFLKLVNGALLFRKGFV